MLRLFWIAIGTRSEAGLDYEKAGASGWNYWCRPSRSKSFWSELVRCKPTWSKFGPCASLRSGPVGCTSDIDRFSQCESETVEPVGRTSLQCKLVPHDLPTYRPFPCGPRRRKSVRRSSRVGRPIRCKRRYCEPVSCVPPEYELIWRSLRKGTRVTASDPPISEDIFARLTQTQLDEARADPDNPPKIDGGTVDTETGKPLVWRGKSRSSDEP